MQRFILIVIGLLLCAIVSTAQAVMTVSLVNRGVEATSTLGSDSDSNSTTGLFSSGAIDSIAANAIAAQSTTIDPLHIFGDGHASIDGFGTRPQAHSVIAVLFELDSPHNYLLDVSLFAITGAGFPLALFLLEEDGLGAIYDITHVDPSLINESGVLPMGNYTLLVLATAESDQDGLAGAAFAFDLLLTPQQAPNGAIPEPVSAGLTLLALSALGLAATRRGRA